MDKTFTIDELREAFQEIQMGRGEFMILNNGVYENLQQQLHWEGFADCAKFIGVLRG